MCIFHLLALLNAAFFFYFAAALTNYYLILIFFSIKCYFEVSPLDEFFSLRANFDNKICLNKKK